MKDNQSKKWSYFGESYEFINSIEKFDNLKLRGLMYFPDIGKSDKILSDYSKVAGLLTAIKNGDTLSHFDDYPLLYYLKDNGPHWDRIIWLS